MVDNERFMRYWTQAQPVVAGYINSMMPDAHEAEDVLQEVAVVLLRKFGDYDPERSFVAWALGVTKFEILSARRSHARSFITYHGELMDAVADVYDELSPELEARGRALTRCLKKVKGRARELLKLRYEKSLKPGRIAQMLEMAAGTVRVQLSRLRASLGECVERVIASGGPQ